MKMPVCESNVVPSPFSDVLIPDIDLWTFISQYLTANNSQTAVVIISYVRRLYPYHSVMISNFDVDVRSSFFQIQCVAYFYRHFMLICMSSPDMSIGFYSCDSTKNHCVIVSTIHYRILVYLTLEYVIWECFGLYLKNKVKYMYKLIC